MSDIKITGVRVHFWVNTDTLEPMFGIQVRTGYKKWLHLSVKGQPLFFSMKDDAAKKCAELKRHYDLAA